MRRFSRRTIAFPKNVGGHAAVVSLYTAARMDAKAPITAKGEPTKQAV